MIPKVHFRLFTREIRGHKSCSPTHLILLIQIITNTSGFIKETALMTEGQSVVIQL